MNNLLRMGVVFLVATLVVAVFWWMNRAPSFHPDRLELYGNVDIRQVELAFRVAGRVEHVTVEEGDTVTEGQELARLDAADFVDAVRLAESQLAGQQALLDALTAGSRPEEVRRAQAELQRSQAELRYAQISLEREEGLAERDIVSHQSHDEVRLQLDLATAGVRAAEQTLALIRSGPREEDIRAASARRDALAVALVIARRRLKDTRLLAPNNGVILTRVHETGAIVAAGAPVFSLSLSSPVWVRTYVEEPDLGHIEPGQRAAIFTDSGGEYAGHVGFISPSAEFTPRTVQTRELRSSLVYRVRIVVDVADGGLRQGMPVTVYLDAVYADD